MPGCERPYSADTPPVWILNSWMASTDRLDDVISPARYVVVGAPSSKTSLEKDVEPLTWLVQALPETPGEILYAKPSMLRNPEKLRGRSTSSLFERLVPTSGVSVCNFDTSAATSTCSAIKPTSSGGNQPLEQ